MKLPLCFLIIPLAILSLAQAEPPTTLLKLSEMTSDQLNAAIREAIVPRQQLVDEAIAVIKHANQPDRDRSKLSRARVAIEKLNGIEAVPTLLEQIDVLTWETGGGPGGTAYPFQDILIHLGPAAVNPMRTVIEKEKDPIRLDLMANVMQVVMGRKAAIGKLNDWLDELNEDNKSKSQSGMNLNAMLKFLQDNNKNVESVDPRLKTE